MKAQIFLQFALILIATKIFGLFSRRMHLPQVVGALLSGILLGPALLNIVDESELITTLASIGVVILMFSAGLETDLNQLRSSWKSTFLIAVMGILLPIGGGFVLGHFFGQNVMMSIFLGVVLTATSVSISVETLHEMGKLKSKAGTAILGAAVIDDILGVVILSVIIGAGEGEVSPLEIGWTLLRIFGFFALTLVLGLGVYKLFSKLSVHYNTKKRMSIFALAFCFFMVYMAEQFGVADIIGAYFAGLVLCNSKEEKHIQERTETMSYMFFSPIFFVSVGLMTTFDGINGKLVLFAALLLIIAIVTKFAGCGLGALMCKYSKSESAQIGAGMISRGEVAIIVATKGMTEGLMAPDLFSSVIIVVITTTLIAPFLLKAAFSKDKPREEPINS
ncbi:MAG: cation:proton antiporter [Oscillospiraceae bacterium]|nr:cation:proton antiporter [Oscillospiraceae bacterium]